MTQGLALTVNGYNLIIHTLTREHTTVSTAGEQGRPSEETESLRVPPVVWNKQGHNRYIAAH